MSKLTLSVRAEVASRAKRYAKRQGTSVSRMVEAYLTAVTGPPRQDDAPPILKELRGSLKHANIEDYRKYLREKYR